MMLIKNEYKQFNNYKNKTNSLVSSPSLKCRNRQISWGDDLTRFLCSLYKRELVKKLLAQGALAIKTTFVFLFKYI